ncbi:PAP/25A associated domain-containing protein [Aphelenchoides besseyi]|nr:PAP/25A associated domain-containing protein [Aphelenchoides besseyi]
MVNQQTKCKAIELDESKEAEVRESQERVRKTKWVPLPAELTNFRSPHNSTSSVNSAMRKRGRRKRKEQQEKRPQKPISPSLASTCSSDSSGLGSLSSGSVTRLRAESTDALESSGCSSVGINDEPPQVSDLNLERDCESTIDRSDPTPSTNTDGPVDWSNPTLKRYFEEQRAFYRKVYDQHFASLRYATDISLGSQFNQQCSLTSRRGYGKSNRQITNGKQKNQRGRLFRPLQGQPDVDNDFKRSIAKLDPLSAQIYKFQKSIEQTPASLCSKLHLRDLIYVAISSQLGGSGLYIVGSTLNGFGNSSSDMDLCLMVTHGDLDQRYRAGCILNTVRSLLSEQSWVKDMELILAKVPILRATFNAPFEDIVVDLNVNNSVAIRNTHLLAYYSGYDWRVRPLVCAVKAWAKRRGINNANQSSLTSYSLVLLVIHYLQCGVKPAILPSLQELYKSQFAPKKDICELDISQPLKPVQGWESGRSTVALGDLLVGFFRYYAFEFDFDNQAISVRRGRAVPRAEVVTNKSPHNSLSQWRCICIEEPMLQTNTAHAVYDERIFQSIKSSIEMASRILEERRDLEALLAVEPINLLL